MFQKRQIEQLKIRQTELESDIVSLTRYRNNLLDKVDKLETTNKRLQAKQDIEEEQIAHKLTMREETNDLENLKKIQVKDAECAKKISEVKDKYQDKLEGELKKRGDEMKEMYKVIVGKVPTITANLKKI